MHMPGPGWGPVRVGAHMGPLWGPYGAIWAHVVPYGAHMGPPGQVLAGPDMSDFGLLVRFRMFWVQGWVFDKISG